jgi:hypothetical protein
MHTPNEEMHVRGLKMLFMLHSTPPAIEEVKGLDQVLVALTEEIDQSKIARCMALSANPTDAVKYWTHELQHSEGGSVLQMATSLLERLNETVPTLDSKMDDACFRPSAHPHSTEMDKNSIRVVEIHECLGKLPSSLIRFN